MPRFTKEKVKFIDDEGDLQIEERRRQKPDNRKILILCCCLCVALVLVGLFLVWFGKNHFHRKPKQHHVAITCNSSECLGDIDLSKLGIPKNMSELLLQNDKLCDTVTLREPASQYNIYIVKDDQNLTDEQACGIESILRLFPDRTVYLIDFAKKEDLSYSKCSSKPNYLGLLTYLYKDRLELLKADQKEFFKDTPLFNVTRKVSGKPPCNNFLFLAVLLTAYKYGGFVTTPDAIMTSRDMVECFPEETVVEPFAILTSKRCDDFLHYLMKSFSLCEQVQMGDLDEVLTLSADLFSRSKPPCSSSARR